MISFDETTQQFYLDNGRVTYCLGVERGRYLAHRYFGRHMRTLTDAGKSHFNGWSFAATPDPDDPALCLDALPREYPDMNQGDFRTPAYVIQTEDGRRVSRFAYEGYEIVPGKPGIPGLPSAYVERADQAETLVVTLADAVMGARIRLHYTVFRDLDVICRHAEIQNDRPAGEPALYLERAASMSLDMPPGPYDVITLGGSAQYEKQIRRRPLSADAVAVESTRGASSPQATPCAILCAPDAGEDAGEVWGFAFVYSGDFLVTVQRSAFDDVRVQVGMNPLTFGWELGPGEAFITPETVMAYSAAGLNGMSQTFHRLVRSHLCRGAWRDRPRPVLFNSWEAFEFDIDEDACLRVADEAARLGIELFVLDDGWFKGRTGEGRALGDWVDDRAKFPDGLAALAARIRAKGLGFGLWFESEMICPVSDLIEAHPDWVIRSPRYEPLQSRRQYVLDLANPAVRDYLVDAMGRVLADTGATYVKWDMNRHITDLGSAYLDAAHQRELSHRYMLGLYDVMGRLTAAFPEVLFEGCSAGGGRFDLGILCFMSQVWASDNSDAVSRLSIQYGTSMLFPPVTMGAHVSDCPNGSTAHMTPLSLRFAVAASANLGYELDVSKLSAGEKDAVREQIRTYKRLRETVQHGTFWRILNPQTGNECAWDIVSEDGGTVVFFWCRVQVDPLYRSYPVKLAGLDPAATYRLEADGSLHGGDELMYAGIRPYPAHGDLAHELLVFHRVDA